MKFFLILFLILFITSCNNYDFCVHSITITDEQVKKLNDYVKANIKPVDDSYKGATYNIEGKKYPADAVEEARKKVLPELVKALECK